MRTLCVGIFAATSVLFGQLESNSITVMASRSVYLEPNQVVVIVNVNSPLNATLDTIVAALQGSGITASSLSYDPDLGSTGAPYKTWSFNLTTPLASMNNTLASLTAIEQSMMQKDGGLSIDFGVASGGVQPQLHEAQSCPIGDLVSDARNQAQMLAAASGLTLGSILAISDGSSRAFALSVGGGGSSGVGVPGYYLPATTYRVFTTPPVATCAIIVQFTLLRYQ